MSVFEVNDGEILSGVYVMDDEVYTVHSGGKVVDFTLKHRGELYIKSGAVASDITIDYWSNMFVQSGGYAKNVTAQGTPRTGLPCHLTVENGGIVDNVTAHSGGIVCVESGGVANALTVTSGGSVWVSGGATVNELIWTPCIGKLYIDDNASVTYASQYSGVYHGWQEDYPADDLFFNKPVVADIYGICGLVYVMSGGSFLRNNFCYDQLYVWSGGFVSDTTIASGASMYMSSGAKAVCTVVDNSFMYVSNGALAASTGVGSGGTMFVLSGANANSTTVSSGGKMYISSGGVAEDTKVCNFGAMYIDCGVANRITASESIHVSSGGVANSVFLDKGGKVYVSSGGVADILETNNYGKERIYVYSGALVKSATLNKNGILHVSGGVASDSIINGLGKVYVSGGKADNTEVNSGGAIHVSSGGTVRNTTVNTAGSMHIFYGGGANYTTVDNGDIHISSGGKANITVLKGSMHISSGGVSHKTAVSGGGLMHISGGGTAYDTEIFYSGKVYVSNNAVANDTTVNSGGNMHIYNGGTANSITVNSGGSMCISSGGIANSTTVNSGGDMYISSGGTANSTTVNSGGGMYISSGGTANSTTVNSGGNMHIASGVTATAIKENGGYVVVAYGANVTFLSNTISGLVLYGYAMTVHSNTTANSTTVNSGGWMFISSDGTANNTTVNSGGNMHIYNGGTANSTTVNSDGRIHISSGGTANSTTVNSSGWMHISSGGTANSTTVNSGGSMHINNGGVANSTIVNHWCRMVINSGGTATAIKENGGYVVVTYGANVTFLSNTISGVVLSNNSMTVHSNTIANSTTVNHWGRMAIHSGGTANSTTVNSSGWMVIHSGGTANSTTVNSGGSMIIYGVHSGSLNIEDGAIVSAYDGSIVDFSVAGRKTSDGYLINNLSLISGNPDYTVTVTANQEYGIYKLALGAENFNGTISVSDETSCYGNITVSGNPLIYNGNKYILTNDNGNLLLTIGDTIPPTLEISGNPTDWTNQDVTLTATVSDGTVEFFNGSEWVTGNTHTVSANGTYTFRATDVFGNIAEKSVTVSLIDKDAPTLSISGNPTDWTNQDVTLTATVSDGTVEFFNGSEWVAGAEHTVSANGTYTFRVTDLAGNITEKSISVDKIDKEAPTLSISGNPTAWTNQDVILTATVSDGTVEFFNGSEWIAGAEHTVSANGTYKFRVTDIAGNITEKTVSVDKIEKEAPEKPSAVADITAVTNKDVTVTATFSTDSAKKEYSLDGKAWKSYTSGIKFAQNGTVYFRGIDAAGNISAVASYTVGNIDKVAPEKPSAKADITAVTNKDVTVTATFSGDSAKKEYSLDNKTWQSYTSGIKFAQNGTVYFRGIDAVGNISAVASYTVGNIDKVAPEKPSAKADITVATNKDVTVTATFSTDSAKKEYSLDGKTWQSYTSGIKFAQNGTVYFRGIDAAGNISAVASYTVGNIDKVAPEKPSAKADITAATNKDVTVTATFSGDSAKKEYSLDGKAWKSYTSGIKFAQNGTVYFRGIDAAGNISAVASYTVGNIDKVAPATPVVSADITTPTNKNVTVTAKFAADAVKNEYKLGNGEWQSYVNGVVFTDNGTVSFRSCDAEGNYTDIVSYTVRNIDKVAPATPLVSADITTVTNKNVTVRAAFSEDSVVKSYSFDNKNYKSYTSAVVMSSNGTVYFKAADAAGNVSNIVSYTVSNIDKTAPANPIVKASTTSPTNKTVSVTATFSGDTVSKQYSRDNKTWMAYQSAIVFSSNGTVYFRGIDAAGNAAGTSYTVSNIDKVAPSLTISGNSSSLCRKVTLKAAASDASGIKLTQYSFDNKTWTAGTSVTVTKNGTVYFKTTDNAGNVTTKSTAVTKISTVPPTANLLSNGVSQIVGWDKAKGAVGFMATDGVPGNKWRGVWDWDGKDVDLWRVVGVGHFAGSKVDYDGILLYNGIGTTFAAWTNLNDPSYGYVNLCHVEGNFNTKCLTDLDSDKYDDVLIYDEKGSFGVVLDGATYKDIWHVDNATTNPWQLCGAGSFGGTADKLVVKNTSGHLYLWTNNDPTFKTWNWSQSVLGYIGNDFEFVDIGDFKGDGKDDILLKKKADGGLWVWDDGNASTARWVVTPEKGFEVEGIGDYNGDCKDDILVREYNTGWGGLGYYAPGGDTLWNDLNARIETGYESNFAIIV